MSLNPVQFGKDVIDQFGRYLMTTFPVADERLAAQVRARLRHTVGSESLLYKGPYVHLNQPFKPGPLLDELVSSGQVHRALRGVFPYPGLHWHQGEALRSIQQGKHTILSTGTGSGKTESFMLPIIDYCLGLRDRNEPSGVVAVLVYPMNALVNDQLDRLRVTLAGTRITFGRYTGETPRDADINLSQFRDPTGYSAKQLEAYHEGAANFGDENLPLPWEEAVDQESIRQMHPRILLTNYAQLEYLLLRDRDLHLFRDAPLRFLVFDEVHTYTGSLGSEVACLIRRLRDVANKSSSDVVMIGTSATVSDRPDPDEDPSLTIDTEEVTRRFAHRLFGVPYDDVMVIREEYRDVETPEDLYLPPLPDQMIDLLDELLEEARALQLQTDIEPEDVPVRLVELAAYLCGVEPNNDPPMQQLSDMLWSNACVDELRLIFTEPSTWEEALDIWRKLDRDRANASDDTLIAEMLAYLTLGAIAQRDGDPILRPKLHYFVQGLQGLGIAFDTDQEPVITFDDRDNVLPLLLCRSCGQHYTRLIAGEHHASDESSYGYWPARIPSRFEEPDEHEGTGWFYLTDQFHTQTDEESDDVWQIYYMCIYCHTLHQKREPHCLNEDCGAEGSLVAMQGNSGEPTRCGACGGPNKNKTRLISYTRSSDVGDVTILAQSMLTMMVEKSLRKVLIFADSRQEAAFQAGWMDRRAKRYRLRHIAFQVAADAKSPLNWKHIYEEIIARAQDSGVLPRTGFDNEDQQTQVRWFLIEELASSMQRRSNLEQLGLIQVKYADFDDTGRPIFEEWAQRLDRSPAEIRNVVQLLLDSFRRRGHLSDDLLVRWWSNRDREVFHNLISVPDFYRPRALVLDKGGNRSSHLVGLIASNGRSGAQVLVKDALGIDGNRRDTFLREVWDWLIQGEYLVPVQLVMRRQGGIQDIKGLPSEVYHVNVDLIGVAETHKRYVCTHCHRAQQSPTPSGVCPEYNCAGTLVEEGRDAEHFDVVQYTQLEFVPMNVREHSAQVPQKRRLEAERSFKSESGVINSIVATPTLEMGVDIGKLEMVVMRNVPPTPANYAQRSGRAGRRHRIAAVFTYAGGSQHDRYFFADPKEMIAGSVRVPAFSMQNEPLVRKHVHSATLTALRELTDHQERTILDEIFPIYINAYLADTRKDNGRERLFYYDDVFDVSQLGSLIKRYRKDILERLVATFQSDWPETDKDAVDTQILAQYLDEMPDRLQSHVRYLFNQVQAYRHRLNELRKIESQSGKLRADEKIERRRLEIAMEGYTSYGINNYTLSWLCVNGFFPGYALSRESVQATSPSPFLQISRNASTALRELTPANWIYADGNVFSPARLNFNRMRAEYGESGEESLREVMYFDREKGRLFDRTTVRLEGGHDVSEVTSYQLTDVEMEKVQNIDDSRESRRRIAFDIHGMLLDRHHGGLNGRFADKHFRYLSQETVRLVNLGPLRVGPTGIQGFPLCPVCGESRTPQSTDEEILRFRDAHRDSCYATDVAFYALHVELHSDVLVIGPFGNSEEAINTQEGILVGAGLVLDMGGNELEGFTYGDENDAHWIVLYDPLPGGTGFLRQILEHWPRICQRGAKALNACDCEVACYQCLQHFRNQRFHPILDRHLASQLLEVLQEKPEILNEIAPRVEVTDADSILELSESPAEDKFIQRLQQQGFPLPSSQQYRVDLGNGNYTLADYAWEAHKLIIFIDGTSSRLHGNPETAARDRLKRRQAQMQGWQVIQITAQELDDEVMLGYKLDEIALILE